MHSGLSVGYQKLLPARLHWQRMYGASDFIPVIFGDVCSANEPRTFRGRGEGREMMNSYDSIRGMVYACYKEMQWNCNGTESTHKQDN